MPALDLFPREQIVGVFIGFREGGMEFHADLVLPYRHEFQSVPMHGQFLLVQLETPDEAVLGRITAFSPDGKLAHGAGEEFTIRALRERRPVPEDLRQDYLKYRVNIRVLGVLRNTADQLLFVPSHRRLPHVGSPVAFPSSDVLREIAGHNASGAAIGHLALGEYVFAEGSQLLEQEQWMQVRGPEVVVRFPIDCLVSRRSFIFARAGFGKSNLNKLLFSELYRETPIVLKRGNREVPVGTIIFDPDGEYFWPDDKGRPGLCDVPWLQDKLVVFTSRRGPSHFYQSFVAGGIRLDIRQLKPRDVISIAISPDRQEQQNVRKLAGLSDEKWRLLVDLIDENRHESDLREIRRILGLEEHQDVEALAARANMTSIVTAIHDRTSQMMQLLETALREGKLCVVDVSQMRGGQSLMLSGLILRYIFDKNQEQFTAAMPRTIPVIAVIEEAQSVLDERKSGAEPYITWVKEGRKYDLGALLVTQQPGSIPKEILSQGDNWFVFHLLSRGDLGALSDANAHFSNDLLSALLNEPIVGQGVFWSSVASNLGYPVPLRTLSFEKLTTVQDPDYNRNSIETFAACLRMNAEKQLLRAAEAAGLIAPHGNGREEPAKAGSDGRTVDPASVMMTTALPATEHRDLPDRVDPLQIYELLAVDAVRNDRDTQERLAQDGLPWFGINRVIHAVLPETLPNRDDLAHQMVQKVLDQLFGSRAQSGWHTFKHPQTGKTWVKQGPGGAT